MNYRLLLALAFGLGCLLSLNFTVAAAGGPAPQTPCPAYYTVRWGDTLAKIATDHRVSLAALIRLNQGRVRDPNRIYAGQTLCIPAERHIALSATYHFKPTGDASASYLLAHGGHLGREAAYPVQQTDLVSTTAEIAATFAPFPPLLLGVINDPAAATYTLYAVGDGRLLLPLVLTDTQTLTTVLPLQTNTCNTQRFSLLGAGLSDVATATLRLETNSSYLPFTLSRLALHRTLEQVLECIDETQIGFVIAAAGPRYPDAYRVTLRLEGNIVGPPGATRALRCARWPAWGWFYRWLRAWYGC